MHAILGGSLAVSAGIINGLFALPMKRARHWSWENVWLPFSLLGLVLFPLLLALGRIPRLAHAYSQLGTSTLLTPVAWGVVIYFGSLLFGRSIVYIGTALAFSLLVGTMSIVGVLTPLLVFSPGVLKTAGGRWILSGMGSLMLALVACARAGTLKARREESAASGSPGRISALRGMALATIGGAMSGLLGLGLNTGWAHAISACAVQFGGARPAEATNAVLLLVLWGGAIPNCMYCLYLLSHNGTWPVFRTCTGYWWLVVLMGAMYSGSTALWGLSTAETMLGRLGPSVGWALFVSAIAVASNAGGFVSGEWKEAGAVARRAMLAGLGLIVLAMMLIGYGNLLL